MDALEALVDLSKGSIIQFKDRRFRPRYGVMKEIEDTTHQVLRQNAKRPKAEIKPEQGNKTASLDALTTLGALAKSALVQFPAKPNPKMKDYGSHFDAMWTRVSSTRPELAGVKEVASDRENVRYPSKSKQAKVVPIDKKKPDKIASMKNTDKKQAAKSMNYFDKLIMVAKSYV